MSTQPNILVFMTDQQHYDTVISKTPCYMPNVQRVAEYGVRFNHAYTPTPTCTPARTSALTGVYPHRHRITHNAHSAVVAAKLAEDKLSREFPTMGNAFQNAGYRTAYMGKWHVGNTDPAEYGFEECPRTSKTNKTFKLWDTVEIPNQSQSKALSATTDRKPEETHPFMVANQVTDFLEEHNEKHADKPFFVFSSCLPPHVPWYAAEPYASMYDPDDIPEPNSYRDTLEDKPLTYTKHYGGYEFTRFQDNWPELSKAIAKYYGICTLIDDAFGQIIDRLEKLKLLENTIVVFTSDHGELLGAHGLVGKNELGCEEIIRVPLVMAGPSIKQGTIEEPVTLCDLFTTFIRMANIDHPAPADSRDMTPLLTNSTDNNDDSSWPDTVFFGHSGTSFFNAVRGVRTSSYKYIFRPHEIDELYDLQNDADEMVNQIENRAYEDILYDLRLQLLKWTQDTEDYAHKGMMGTFRGVYQREIVV